MTNAPAVPAPAPPSFSSLGLSGAVLENLQRLGYEAMTPIQAATLPLALQGHDLIAQAATGSGKTAAFSLALLARLNPRWFSVQALVLCPTRELADQVSTEIRRLARAADNIKVVTLCGGVPLRMQSATLEHGAHVAVGTPGRILDHLGRGTLNLQGLNTLVLDEADRMLDMGFLEDIREVVRHTPTQRHTLLFSATFPEGIAALAQEFMQTPQRIVVQTEVERPQIEQRFYEVDRTQRLPVVARVLHHLRPASTIAFCNTKQQCRELVEVLRAQGIAALALHGDLEQRERDMVLAQFSNQSCPVLVATDVAARGIDVKDLAAVINVDISPDPEVHIHRIGRTARAGSSGVAISLATARDQEAVARIAHLQGQSAVWGNLQELTPASTDPLEAPMTTLQLLGGRKEKIRPGDVLGALTGAEGGAPLTREQIGKIQVTDFCTFIAVRSSVATKACDKLNAARVKGRNVKVRVLDVMNL